MIKKNLCKYEYILCLHHIFRMQINYESILKNEKEKKFQLHYGLERLKK